MIFSDKKGVAGLLENFESIASAPRVFRKNRKCRPLFTSCIQAVKRVPPSRKIGKYGYIPPPFMTVTAISASMCAMSVFTIFQVKHIPPVFPMQLFPQCAPSAVTAGALLLDDTPLPLISSPEYKTPK